MPSIDKWDPMSCGLLSLHKTTKPDATSCDVDLCLKCIARGPRARTPWVSHKVRPEVGRRQRIMMSRLQTHLTVAAAVGAVPCLMLWLVWMQTILICDDAFFAMRTSL